MRRLSGVEPEEKSRPCTLGLLRRLRNLDTPEYCAEPWRIFEGVAVHPASEGPCGIEPKEKLRPCTLGLQRLDGSFSLSPSGCWRLSGVGRVGPTRHSGDFDPLPERTQRLP